MEPILPGLVPTTAYLIDERSRPDFRDLFGTLAARSTEIVTAVTRIRLSTVDLNAAEIGGVRSMRVLVSEISAMRLEREARGLLTMPGRAPNVRLLTRLLEQERLELRSAPLGGWSPDFTVFADDRGPFSVLAGFHAFERPYPHRGPALISLHGEDAARLAGKRHGELWDGAHDIGPVVWDLLARAERRSSLRPTG